MYTKEELILIQTNRKLSRPWSLPLLIKNWRVSYRECSIFGDSPCLGQAPRAILQLTQERRAISKRQRATQSFSKSQDVLSSPVIMISLVKSLSLTLYLTSRKSLLVVYLLRRSRGSYIPHIVWVGHFEDLRWIIVQTPLRCTNICHAKLRHYL